MLGHDAHIGGPVCDKLCDLTVPGSIPGNRKDFLLKTCRKMKQNKRVGSEKIPKVVYLFSFSEQRCVVGTTQSLFW